MIDRARMYSLLSPGEDASLTVAVVGTEADAAAADAAAAVAATSEKSNLVTRV